MQVIQQGLKIYIELSIFSGDQKFTNYSIFFSDYSQGTSYPESGLWGRFLHDG